MHERQVPPWMDERSGIADKVGIEYWGKFNFDELTRMLEVARECLWETYQRLEQLEGHNNPCDAVEKAQLDAECDWLADVVRKIRLVLHDKAIQDTYSAHNGAPPLSVAHIAGRRGKSVVTVKPNSGYL